MPANTKTKDKENVFHEEVASVYQVEMSSPRHNMFELDIDVQSESEQYMLDALHTQAVAVSGRAALAQFATERIGEMANYTSFAMTGAMEQIQQYETAANVGRFEKPLQHFNNRLLDDTARSILETNREAIIRMGNDAKTTIYPMAKPPAAPKRKGALRGFKDFLFGEG